MGNVLWRNRVMIMDVPALLMRVETFILAGRTASTTGIATTGAHQTQYGGGYR